MGAEGENDAPDSGTATPMLNELKIDIPRPGMGMGQPEKREKEK